MKYLKQFETQSAYDTAKSGLVLPNVSLINADGHVEYNPSSPAPTHEYVEIGGIKWATMNIGASSVTDYGQYFQWGDTQGYTAAQVGSGEGLKPFRENDYIYYNGSYTKYNSTDGKTVLESTDDAVKAAWGGNWRMPTTEELQALGAVCSTAWTTTYEGSASGMLLTVTADTADYGKQLFFPACGGAYFDSVKNVGSGGWYWSSSLKGSYDGRYAYNLYFSVNGVYWHSGNDSRYYGCSVRGVLDE